LYKTGFTPSHASPQLTSKRDKSTERQGTAENSRRDGGAHQKTFNDIDEVSQESVDSLKAGKKGQRNNSLELAKIPGRKAGRRITSDTPLGRKSLSSLHQKTNKGSDDFRFNHA